MSELGEKQELFADLESQWVRWVLSHPGWKLRRGEGRILQLGPDGKTGRRALALSRPEAVVFVKDLVHKDGGTHYAGTACDWQLFVEGQHIENGGHPVWTEIGEKWESMHPLARWGGRWGDANHISLEHEGVK